MASVNSKKKNIRKSRQITNPADIEYILSLSPKEASSRHIIMELFADFGDGPRFNTYDTIVIPKGSYGKTKKNKNDFTTTVGLYIFNKGCIEDMSDVLGYINKPINGDTYDDINQAISYARLEDKITIEQLKRFIMQSQIYMSCTSALSPSHTIALLTVNQEIDKKKQQLLKTDKYKDVVKNKDAKLMAELEKELIEYFKDYLSGDPSLDMYDSGARSSYNNHVRNFFISRGALLQSDGSVEIVTSSYMDGMDKEDLVKVNDAASGGPYARAVKTKEGGYKEKQILYALQHVHVLGPGTDCHTDRTIPISITKSNIKNWMYSFVKTSGSGANARYVEITSDNMDTFIGKTVQVRFSGLCEHRGGICEKCAGTLFNRLGISNAGLACDAIASKLKNTSMKQFHDSTLKFNEIDIEKAFGFE